MFSGDKPYRISIRLLAVILLVSFLLSRTDLRGQSLNKDVKNALARAPREHPRLFSADDLQQKIRKKVETSPLLTDVVSLIKRVADRILNRPPAKREKTGRRLLGVSRTVLKRITHLAMAYRITKEQAYLERARAELLAAASFRDWNPSHFLDVAEMTAAMAIGYDWLYPELDSEKRTKIRTAIVEKGLKTSMEGGWWVETTNNWNQVCHGGLTLGALSVYEHHPELARKVIVRAIRNVPRAMKQYQPDGAYPEGPTYWTYGTSYNVLLLAGLTSTLGTDFDLMSSFPSFMKSPVYYLHATGPTDRLFNYSDSGTRADVNPHAYWMAATMDRPEWLWKEKQRLKRKLKQNPAKTPGRLFPFLLLWANRLSAVRTPNKLHWKGEGKTPVAFHRTGWTPDATYVAIKGGSPKTNHAHMDIGSFVFEARGVRWAIDLGAQSYHDLESSGVDLWNSRQDSERWTVFRLNNFSHNTLVVDGKHQRVSGHAPIVDFSREQPMPHTIVDLSSVYQEQLARARRGVGLLRDGSVLIQDEIQARERDGKTEIRWGMVTGAEVSISASRQTARLKQDGKTLRVVLRRPSSVDLTTFQTANPPREYDAGNPGTQMIGMKISVPPNEARTLAVHLIPADGSEDEPIQISPLDEW